MVNSIGIQQVASSSILTFSVPKWLPSFFHPPSALPVMRNEYKIIGGREDATIIDRTVAGMAHEGRWLLGLPEECLFSSLLSVGFSKKCQVARCLRFATFQQPVSTVVNSQINMQEIPVSVS